MRKILLGSTAVVSLALVAQAANAQQGTTYSAPVGITGAGPGSAAGSPAMPQTPTTSGLTVRLGGFFDFSVGSVSDSADKAYYRNFYQQNSLFNPLFAATAPTGSSATNLAGSTAANSTAVLNSAKGRQRTDFRTEAELNIYVDGIAANGLRYGAVLEMQMDNVTSSGQLNMGSAGQGSGTGVDFDEMYGFVKGGWGELRFGQFDSAASLMQVRRPSVLWMGSDSAWDEFTVNNVNGTPYIMAGVNDGNDATKIAYLSPQFAGFDVGVSYSPNRNEGENFLNPTNTQAYQRDFAGLTNEISAALRYRGTLGPVGVQASMVGQWADAARQSTNGIPVAVQNQNVNAYSAGLVLSAMGFQVGGEYTWGNYWGSAPGGASLPKGWDGSKHYVVGGVYTTGPLSVGVQYGSGTQDNGTNASLSLPDRTQNYLGFGVAYVIAPGMTFFANYNQIKDENVPFLGAAGSLSNGVSSPSNTSVTTPSASSSTGNTNGIAKFDSNGSQTRDIQVVVAGLRIAF